MSSPAKPCTATIPRPGGGRPGFTTVEIVLALSLLGVVMVLVARGSYGAMIERLRSATRQGALEAAGNILEAARARPWEDLTPEWAAAQRLPETWTNLQPDGRLEVRVEPEATGARTKRVTVAMRWDFRPGIPPQELELVTLFSAREVSR